MAAGRTKMSVFFRDVIPGKLPCPIDCPIFMHIEAPWSGPSDLKIEIVRKKGGRGYTRNWKKSSRCVFHQNRM